MSVCTFKALDKNLFDKSELLKLQTDLIFKNKISDSGRKTTEAFCRFCHIYGQTQSRICNWEKPAPHKVLKHFYVECQYFIVAAAKEAYEHDTDYWLGLYQCRYDFQKQQVILKRNVH